MQLDVTAARVLKAGYQAKQRGLATPGWSKQGKKFVFLDFHGNVF